MQVSPNILVQDSLFAVCHKMSLSRSPGWNMDAVEAQQQTTAEADYCGRGRERCAHSSLNQPSVALIVHVQAAVHVSLHAVLAAVCMLCTAVFVVSRCMSGISYNIIYLSYIMVQTCMINI